MEMDEKACWSLMKCFSYAKKHTGHDSQVAAMVQTITRGGIYETNGSYLLKSWVANAFV